MRIYVDTNVWLDFLGGRRSKYLLLDEFAARIFDRIETGEFELVMSNHLMKQLELFVLNKKALEELLQRLVPHMLTTRVRHEDKSIAAKRGGEFEDMLHYAIAERTKCDLFITGDKGLYFLGTVKIVASKDV